MTSNSPSLMMTSFNQLCLEIPEDSLTQFWQTQPPAFSTDGVRWQASLNQACLSAFLPWFREEFAPNAKVWANPATLSSFWEVVNGCAIDFDHHRLVLIPSAAADFAELRVPQEWVDIPDWAGDYYVSVYVNQEDQEIQVLGYTTHQVLKQQGQYDASDRSFCLEADALIADINVLWVTRQLCPEETLRMAIEPLPSLPVEQAENLLDRLGNPDLILPRLAVPFQPWAALIQHGGWRRRLYERRLGLPESWSVQQWLQSGISNLAQQFGWHAMELQPSFVLARGERSQPTVLLRQLTIAGRPYELKIFATGEADRLIWRFELQSATLGSLIPAGFKLRLLTEDLLPFENNEDVATTAVEQLYLEVALSPGDGLVWQTEPLPENYDWEILRF